MKVYKIVAFVASVALLTSCEYQKYNHIEQKDYNKGNEYVYGVSPDSLPRQMSYKYDAQPELDGRVNDIRAKLYGGITSSVVKQ
ncbi:hypothetical protein [Dyadobacter aurulentus]|uniref:hypothetical protein n=1 Tax=Dyadobacter sp. UC 10 TaxID=2605428 RepID=UPI0011F3CDA4|nr:hypothetical protein [Dyadobacter sp. UC 10]KAA0990743.1 hypothetical protein FXO21_11575 [Dyadobacter sp. UC 10]